LNQSVQEVNGPFSKVCAFMSGNKQFDKDVAIDSAMTLFKDKGFSGTSLSELEKETKLNKSSIYNTFGSKDGLYTACLEKFRLHYTSQALAKLEHEDFKTAITDFCVYLFGGFDNLEADQGCLATLAALEMGAQKTLASKSIKAGLDDMLACLEARIQKAIEEKQLADSWHPAQLAAMIVAVNRGAIVLNRGRGDKEAGHNAYRALLSMLFLNQ